MFSIGKMSRQLWLAVGLLLCSGLAMALVSTTWKASASAAALSTPQKLLASDGTAGDSFGISVALSGNTAVIGADNDDGAQGAAYVFVRDGASWMQQVRLVANDRMPLSHFGQSVAISGDTIAVGMLGAAYVFTRSGTAWTQQQKLDSAGAAEFGASVALSGDYLVVGDSLNQGANPQPGKASVFWRSGNVWSLQQELTASDGTAGNLFGASVALENTTIAVGASREGVDAAYVFTRSGTMWTQQQRLTGSDATISHRFGSSMALSGDTVVVGAPLDSTDGGNQGWAYVFTRSGTTWTQQQKLTGDASEDNFYFGQSVALSGDIALIGSDSDDGTPSEAYPFTRGGTLWSPQPRLVSEGMTPGDDFGLSVALDAATALVGAHNERIELNNAQGAAYVCVLSGNQPPLITPRTLTRYQGEGAFDELVATVTDDSNQPATVTIAFNGALPAGISVNNLRIADFTVGAGGVITGNIRAEVAAACSVAPGNYSIGIRATDAQGGQSTASFIVTVEAAADSFTLGASPTDQTVCTSSTVNFTASVNGVVPNAQWQVSNSGGAFTNLSGATNLTLSLPNVTAAQNGNRYRALLTSSCQTVTTNAATLTVASPLTVITPPTDQAACPGATVIFNANANSAAALVQWQVSVASGAFTNLPGEVLTSLTLSNVTTAQNGNRYRAVFTNACGTLTTNAATLTVAPPPVITVQPSPSQSNLSVGQTISYSVTATGFINSYIWRKGGVPIAGAPSSNTFTIPAATLADSGTYDVVVRGGCAVTSVAVTLAVYAAIVVNTASDENGTNLAKCSLREAIQSANLNLSVGGCPTGMPGLDTILFDYGLTSIHLNISLPDILEPLNLNGVTGRIQRMQLDGGQTFGSFTPNGLTFRSGGNRIESLAIINFGVYGLLLDSAIFPFGGSVVRDCYLGMSTDYDYGIFGSHNGYGVYITSPNNLIGSPASNDRNVISGNKQGAIFITGAQATGNVVQGNYLGDEFLSGGGATLLNRSNFLGVAANDGANNTQIIGNVITFNNVGVRIQNANQCTVKGNLIGIYGFSNLTAFQSNGNGIFINGTATNNNIGGLLASESNVIVGSTEAGVAIVDMTRNNRVLGNAIFANAALGIDLGGDGVTANDTGDGDVGANNLQNFPVLTVVTATTISGTLDSTAVNTAYPVRIEFFANTACDASGNGEGEIYLGFTTLSAPGNFSYAFTPVTGKPVITATATDANGNTSEFSACRAPLLCPPISATPGSLSNGQLGITYSQQLTGTGGVHAYSFALNSGGLPSGVTLSSQGLLSGTPTNDGTFNFTVRITDANGCTGLQSYPWVVLACPALTLGALPVGTINTAYNQTISVTGGTGSYSFAVTAGSLPNGLSLNPATGQVSGLPSATGTFNFTVSATAANGCGGTRAYSMVITGLQFYLLAAPVRLLDTRKGASANACFQPAPTASGNEPIPGGTARVQPGRNTCGIPATAQALTGHLTTVQSGGGYLTLYASDVARPFVASTNFNPNQIINNVFTVALATTGVNAGSFNLFALTTTDVVVDVTGYYAPPGAGGLYFHPLPTPTRLLETRPNEAGYSRPGVPLAGNADTAQSGRGFTYNDVTIPATAQALVGNATTVNPSGGGYLTLYPQGAARPFVASSNFNPGDVMNGPFTVGLGATGQFMIYTTATTHLIVDVVGYYSTDATDANGTGLLFTPLPSPTRLLETRAGEAIGCDRPNAPLAVNSTRTQLARGTCTIPNFAQSIVGNATTVNPLGGGYLTFFPSSVMSPPLVATSNFIAGQIINRHFIVGLGGDGAFKIFTLPQTELVVDVSGYFAP